MLESGQIPIDLQTIARLLRGPVSISNHRDAAAFHERYLKHIAHAVELASFSIVDALHAPAKHRRMSHERDLHSRQIEIETKLLRAVALRAAVETRRSLADETKLGRILECHLRRYGLTRGVVGQLRIRSGTIAWSKHGAVFSVTLIRTDFPALRSSSDQHRTRLGAELPILLKR